MKTIIALGIITVSLPLFALAQDSTANAKLDTVIQYQKQMAEQQNKIYEEVAQYKEPLENKKFGIEFNPAYLLVSSARSYLVVSSGFSLFDADRKAEIAFPLFFQDGTGEDIGGYRPSLTLWNQDVIYRRFLGQHQDGFYLSGGLRFTHIRGEAENGISIFGVSVYSEGAAPKITTDKFGMMFGIGYRYFSYSGFYWGTSIVVGRYFSNDERAIKGVSSDDSKLIFDIELLKFGFAF